MIIGLSGYAGSGKNAVAEILVDIGFKQIAFGDALRGTLSALNPIISLSDDKEGFLRYNDIVEIHGYEDGKRLFPEIRRTLQFMATEVGREFFGEDVWINFVVDQIAANPDVDWVITDVRFSNEIEALTSQNASIWRIMRYGFNGVNEHISEHELDKYIFSDVLINDGSLDDLRQKVLLKVEDVKSNSTS